MAAPRTPRNQPPAPADTMPKRRWVDFTMPFPWLVGMIFLGASGLYRLGGMIESQNSLLNQIIASQTKIETRQGEITTRTDTLRDQQTDLKQRMEIFQIRLNAVERSGESKK